jgi:sugar phosphate isomerase/epimerase
MPSRVGVDSYSYHRLLGEVRRGETPTLHLFPRGSLDVVAEARRLALDFALLQTSFLGDPAAFPADEYRAEAGDVALGLSWGAPEGLEFGERREALVSLLSWLPVAARLDLHVMRIVAGGPAHRGQAPASLPALLREACAAAREHGLRLALENHGDLTAAQIEQLLDEVGGDLRVCFDTANALRVGDDPVEAARLLGPRVELVHLKDCEPLDTVRDPVAGPCSVPFGAGVVELDPVLDALEEAEFTGLVCVEIAQLGPGADERELVADGVRWLRARAGKQAIAAVSP